MEQNLLIESLEKQISNLTEELEKSKEVIKDLKDDKEELEEEIDDLEDEVKELKDEVDSLRIDLEDTKQMFNIQSLSDEFKFEIILKAYKTYSEQELREIFKVIL